MAVLYLYLLLGLLTLLYLHIFDKEGAEETVRQHGNLFFVIIHVAVIVAWPLTIKDLVEEWRERKAGEEAAEEEEG